MTLATQAQNSPRQSAPHTAIPHNVVANAFSAAEDPFVSLYGLATALKSLKSGNPEYCILDVVSPLGSVLDQINNSEAFMREVLKLIEIQDEFGATYDNLLDRLAPGIGLPCGSLNGHEKHILRKLEVWAKNTSQIMSSLGIDTKSLERSVKKNGMVLYSPEFQQREIDILMERFDFLTDASGVLEEVGGFSPQIKQYLSDLESTYSAIQDSVFFLGHRAEFVEKRNARIVDEKRKTFEAEASRRKTEELKALTSSLASAEKRMDGIYADEVNAQRAFWDDVLAKSGVALNYGDIGRIITGLAPLIKAGKTAEEIEMCFQGDKGYFEGGARKHGHLYESMCTLRDAGNPVSKRYAALSGSDVLKIYGAVLKHHSSAPRKSGEIRDAQYELESIRGRVGALDARFAEEVKNAVSGFSESLHEEKYAPILSESSGRSDAIKNLSAYIAQVRSYADLDYSGRANSILRLLTSVTPELLQGTTLFI